MSKKRRDQLEQIVRDIEDRDDEKENIIIIYDDGEKSLLATEIKHRFYNILFKTIKGYLGL